MPDRPPSRQYPIARSALAIDRAMNHLIKVGGISIIAAVFGIFLFILLQILPLFRGAQVARAGTVAFPPGDYVALGVDEWGERPFALRRDGTLLALDLGAPGAPAEELRIMPPDIPISALAYGPRRQEIVAGTTDGRFGFLKVNFDPDFRPEGRRIRLSVSPATFLAIGVTGAPIRAIQAGGGDGEKLVAVLQDAARGTECHAVVLTQKRSLTGSGRWTPGRTFDLTPLLQGRPRQLLVNSRADSVLVVLEDHRVQYLFRSPSGFESRQVFAPFATEPIELAEYLFGDDSVIFASASGLNVAYSLYPHGDDQVRRYGLTKTFPALPGKPLAYARSLRNKAFFVASERDLSIRYGTTADIRWAEATGLDIQLAALGSKYDRLLLLDRQAQLHLFSVKDPHPEAGWKAFFGKIWYEGATGPRHNWQSTGGTDDFEPKLSMVPLLVGTLKGTLYAMLFSVPLALLAALYTSQFAHPNLKKFIKPTMEIMASLPSVILGFLSALWLAPLLESRVPSFILMMVLLPALTLAFGYLWSRFPHAVRRRVRHGYEFMAVVPVLLAAGALAWYLGPWLEARLFLGRDLSTGQPIADFRLWWTQVVGRSFEQRNSLVVGFMMGFAVIPIIFTIAEDALSNVPGAFRSASLALGASRWQTALRVIVPTASAGIFSAIMIGFGRAVGETMIVLMATGNTPIMDFNIFSGMRTLSANIAVELPEAPHHGTLFRSLYLGAMLLFLLTFSVNTLAEILRHHLREKYKAV